MSQLPDTSGSLVGRLAQQGASAVLAATGARVAYTSAAGVAGVTLCRLESPEPGPGRGVPGGRGLSAGVRPKRRVQVLALGVDEPIDPGASVGQFGGVRELRPGDRLELPASFFGEASEAGTAAVTVSGPAWRPPGSGLWIAEVHA